MAEANDVPPKLTDADELVLLENSSAQGKSLLHSLEQAAVSNWVYVNSNKTEYMCFKRKGTISTRSSKPLKLVDQLTYIGSNISSTERDVNLRLVKGVECYW